jgi:tetratricopeptide (TPR) repeat protein
VARLRLGLKTEALADVNEALALASTPHLERLRARVLLAMGRIREVAFTRPEEIEALPLAGPTLRDDVLRMAALLRQEVRAGGARPALLRAHLTRAILLSTVRGSEADALNEASQAIDLAPMAANPYLIRARILRRVGFTNLARVDVEQAAALESDNRGVWELRAILKTEGRDPAGGLADLDHAIAYCDAGASIRGPRAEALMALGKPQTALNEWYIAIRADPEDPACYLGRARAFLALRQYDQVIADLEQASNWIEGHPALGLKVLATYARCVAARPAHLPRLLALGRRVLADLAPAPSVRTSAVRALKRPSP